MVASGPASGAGAASAPGGLEAEAVALGTPGAGRPFGMQHEPVLHA